jgi:hypothetical protein
VNLMSDATSIHRAGDRGRWLILGDYADRRLPVPGAIGLAATVFGTAVAASPGPRSS